MIERSWLTGMHTPSPSLSQVSGDGETQTQCNLGRSSKSIGLAVPDLGPSPGPIVQNQTMKPDHVLHKCKAGKIVSNSRGVSSLCDWWLQGNNHVKLTTPLHQTSTNPHRPSDSASISISMSPALTTTTTTKTHPPTHPPTLTNDHLACPQLGSVCCCAFRRSIHTRNCLTKMFSQFPPTSQGRENPTKETITHEFLLRHTMNTDKQQHESSEASEPIREHQSASMWSAASLKFHLD